MKVFTETLGDAPLTCYVLDASEEMASAGRRPAVLVLPGGGYQFTSDREAEPIALAYLAEGFNACVLRYATGDDAPWERSFADGRAALAWMREHADDLAIHPDQIAVVGFSAGGHLAASLGTTDAKPDALVLGYPVTLGEFGPPVGKEILDVPGAVTADYPPTFLFSTSGDTLVPIRNSLALLQALAEHDVPFESHVYLLGPHGISLAKPLTANGNAAMVDAAAASWLADSVRFLRAVFGDFVADVGQPDTFQALLGRRRFNATTPVGRLLADERAVAILDARLPGFVASMAQSALAQGLSLTELSRWQPDTLSPAVLAALDDELQQLNTENR